MRRVALIFAHVRIFLPDDVRYFDFVATSLDINTLEATGQLRYFLNV